MCVRVVGGGSTFEVKECTQEMVGFGGVKRMKQGQLICVAAMHDPQWAATTMKDEHMP
jgi:hypothetical protein